MATDSVAKELESLNRTLREISSTLKEQNRLIKTMAQNYIEVHRQPDEKLLPPFVGNEPVVLPLFKKEKPTKVYGWSMAASVQRDGDLTKGDVKLEQDGSRWVWTDEIWERVEAPSGQA